MKKFNIICIICMLIMLLGIVHNFLAIGYGDYPTYHRVMLVIDGILFGMTLGECWMGNAIVKAECNFEKEKKDGSNL